MGRWTSCGATFAKRTPILASTRSKPGFAWTPLPSPDEVFDRIDLVYYAGAGIVPTEVAIVGEDAANADIVIDPYPSDHRGVAATFRFPGCPDA